MNRSEQARLIDELVPLQYRMSARDKELFDSLHKRHKDDEDLDAEAASRLRRLHDFYRPPKSKKELDDIWNKMTSGSKKP